MAIRVETFFNLSRNQEYKMKYTMKALYKSKVRLILKRYGSEFMFCLLKTVKINIYHKMIILILNIRSMFATRSLNGTNSYTLTHTQNWHCNTSVQACTVTLGYTDFGIKFSDTHSMNFYPQFLRGLCIKMR